VVPSHKLIPLPAICRLNRARPFHTRGWLCTTSFTTIVCSNPATPF
jgi:hypothetical protein